VPGRREPAHQERAIGHGRARREAEAVVEEAGGDRVQAERLQRPAGCFEFNPVEFALGRGGGVADRGAAEEVGRGLNAGEDRSGREFSGEVRFDLDPHRAVAAGDLNPVAAAVFLRLEPGQVLVPGEQAAAGERGQQGGSVAPGDVHAGDRAVGAVPAHRDPVGGVLRSQPGGGQARGPDAAKPDQADARDPVTADEDRPERRRQVRGEQVRVDPVVDQDAALDHGR
jgi:hypothetical protein